jgi:Fe-S-cluster-containing hydrogenase component 2
VNAIKETKTGFLIDRHACKQCGDCYAICPIGAVRAEGKTKTEQEVLKS